MTVIAVDWGAVERDRQERSEPDHDGDPTVGPSEGIIPEESGAASDRRGAGCARVDEG